MRQALLRFMLAMLGLMLACQTPSIFPTPTPEPEPTPLGDSLELKLPTYAVEVEPGSIVPGVQIEYVEKQGDVFLLRFDSSFVEHSAGNRFDWRAVMAPNVIGAFALTVSAGSEDNLRLRGEAEIDVLFPQPSRTTVTLPAGSSADVLYFPTIVVEHVIPIGAVIPGTDIVYERQADAETFVMRDSAGRNLTQKQGNTLRWEGRVRPNVFLRYNLIVEGAATHGVRLDGSAEMWIVLANTPLPTPPPTALPTLTPAP